MCLKLKKAFAKITNLPLHPYAVDYHGCLRFCCGVFVAFAWLTLSTGQAQTTNYVLGTAALWVGPSTGTNSVVLGVTPTTATWVAATNSPWLHLSVANQSGIGSTNVIFSYDANPGGTRSNALTIGDQTLTITQAGSTYVAAGTLTQLVGGLNQACGLAVDRVGNVYIADTGNNAIKEWTVANNTVTTLVSSGLDQPNGVAVDSMGNVFIADTGNNAIKEWTVANSNVTTLVSSGLHFPFALAVDEVDNIYIGDYQSNEIEEWNFGNQTLTALSSAGSHDLFGVALDVAGNLFIGDTDTKALCEWTATDSNLTTLVPGTNFQSYPQGLTVDGSGNVYIADIWWLDIWTAANNTLTSSSYFTPNELAYTLFAVAVDGVGNIYFADDAHNTIQEISSAFVDTSGIAESASAHGDSLPPVLPVTANLLAPFAPTSDQSWITITGITNGVVSFSVAANPGVGRTAHINMLGQSILITQVHLGPPQILSVVPVQGNGVLQLAFGNNSTASFTVLSATNAFLPLSNWTVVGEASNTAPGLFQFTSQPTTNDVQRYFRVRSP
jgi:sugar lactone lactonase YvrE